MEQAFVANPTQGILKLILAKERFPEWFQISVRVVLLEYLEQAAISLERYRHRILSDQAEIIK